MVNQGFSINIPHFYAYVRSEYLYNLESHKGEFTPCLVLAADSIYGRAIGFDILINSGAIFARLPVSALVHKTNAPDIALDYLQLWDNFSYTFEAVEFTAIREVACETILKDGKWYPGNYMFTFSWFGSPYAEDAGEGGFKRAVMIKLDNGCFALQPYNRIRFYEPSFVTEKFPDKPDYLTNSHNWTCEGRTKWATENTDRYFFDQIAEKAHEFITDDSLVCIGLQVPHNYCKICGHCVLPTCQAYKRHVKCNTFIQSPNPNCIGSVNNKSAFYTDHFWCTACCFCTFDNCTRFVPHDFKNT